MNNHSRETHWHYQVYGQRLCSSVPLPVLPRSSFKSRDVAFRYVPSGELLDLAGQKAQLQTRRSTNLGCDLSLYRTGPGFLLRWEGQCDFLVSRDGGDIQCHPGPGADMRWVQGTLYNMILSFVLFLRGVSNFHASAVVLPGGAVGFMADPGSGKSTLSAGFTAQGYPFLTDDVLAIQEDRGRFQGHPGFPHVSLTDHSLDALFGLTGGPPRLFQNGDKQRVSIDGLGIPFCREPVPVKALFILRRSCPTLAPWLERLARVEAMKGLMEHTNCLPLLPPEVLEPHMAFVKRLTASVPVYLLHYPSRLEGIPRVITAVVEQLRTLGIPEDCQLNRVGIGKAEQQ